jgi:hypothetical protein
MIFFLVIFTVIQSASAVDISIVDVYSDIDSTDITIHSGGHHTNITLDADLIFSGKVLESRHSIIEEIPPNTDITKVFSWDLTNPLDGFYHTKITLSANGAILDTNYYNFSYGWGVQATPKIFIKDINSDSRGVSIILTPYVPRFSSEQEPVLTDVEFMLVDGDTVIYRTTERRVAVVQATTLSNNWNVRLENNHNYSTRVKVRISSPRDVVLAPKDAVIAQSEEFTAMDDARITELYRDETGASATILGLSQVPLNGSIVFTVLKDGDIIEETREKSPILLYRDDDNDESIEVTWNNRLPPGVYELSVKIVGNDGDVLDRRDTIIEAKQHRYNKEPPLPTPTKTPGFNISSTVLSLIILYLLSGLAKHKNK